MEDNGKKKTEIRRKKRRGRRRRKQIKILVSALPQTVCHGLNLNANYRKSGTTGKHIAPFSENTVAVNFAASLAMLISNFATFCVLKIANACCTT